MADVVVAFAITKLGDFIVDTISAYVNSNMSLLNELRSNAEWLWDELGYMQSFLNDAEEKKEADYRVRQWISDVREIAKDTTFVLDEVAVKIHGCFGKNGMVGTVRSFVFTCHNKSDISDMNDQMKALKGRVEAISKKREIYGIRSGDGGHGSALVVNELRRTTSYAHMEKLFVGLEDVKSQLLAEIFKSEPYWSVILVHGTGGLGKTTLVRNIYNSLEVTSHFENRVWIHVPQEYNVLGLLRVLIKSIGCTYDQLEMLEKMNVKDLERQIRKLLRDTRYLVVVDDVWKREALESLKRAFSYCGNNSKVIVTTRSRNVAMKTDERVYAHHLRFLEPEESWELFSEKVFRGQEHENWCSPVMQDLGREMVAKCRGLPLAVVVLGGLLLHKQNLEEWQAVKEYIWRHLVNDSIEISHLLSLSYDHLPSMLRQCFLYLGTFPDAEDDWIGAEHLMHLWMGEQLIPLGEEMEDVAESYLNELLNRSLIQVVKRFFDRIFHCRIHDLLRDLAIQKASEEDFFHIYSPSTNHSTLVLQKRHVVHTQIERYFSTNHSNKRLQSLVVHNLDDQQNEAPQSFEIFAKFNNLRLLKLEGSWELDELPNIFGNLLQLIYLGLFKVHVSSLPPSIGELKRLQTLEVVPGDEVMCELPPEIPKLESLRHLICEISGNADIGCLSSLRTLKSIRYEHWAAIEKENLINLQELWIKDIDKEDGKPYILEPFTKFNKLHTLVILCSDGGFLPPLDFLSTCQKVRNLVLVGKIEMLPPVEKWRSSITNLVLVDSNLEEDPIPTLGRLPNLRSLYLGNSHESTTMVFGPNYFPQLQTLALLYLDNLEKLELGQGAMPKIKHFYVFDCDKLVDIPDKLKSVSSHMET